MHINLKVKTLDSQNYDFNVDEEMTVKEFKEHISQQVKIAADLQRLIYCGRVLNDEKPLKEYAVDGKCLHLVQRPPPSSNSPSTSTTNRNTTTTGAGEQRRIGIGGVNVELPNIDNLMMGSFTIPVTAEPSSTLCGNRITVARHMLQCANNIAAFLENPENGLNNQNIDLLAQQTMESTILEVGISAVTDADLPHQEMQSIVQAFQGAVSEAFRQNGINNITVQQHNTAPGIQVVGSIPSTNNNGATASSSITIEFPPNITESSNSSSNSSTEEPPRQPETARRQQTTSPTVLADVVEMMQNVQQRLGPFVQQYYTMLREDPSYPDDEARERAQQIFNRTSEALHYMAHAQHAISDLMLNLSLPTPRHLCCRPILVEQSAFVSSGISQSINIGSMFGRGGIPRNNNNNPSSAPATPATNNNNNSSTATNNDAANQTAPPTANSRNDFASSLLSAMGLAASNMNNRNNNNNNNNNTTNTTSGDTNSSSATTPPSDINRNQEGQERYRNFIQSLMNSAPSDGVHIINANIAVPVRDSSATRERERSRESSQTRSSTNTQPTTSTQTRSTTRPFLTSTTLPSTSIRHGRPIPANFLSSFDRFLPCNSHHIRESQQQHNLVQYAQAARAERPMSRESSNVRREPAPETNRSTEPTQNRQPQQQTPLATTSDESPNVEDELNRRFTLFGIELSLRDLNNLSAGFYGAQRDELRAFLRERFFSEEITEISVTDGVLKMIQEIEKYLERLEHFPQNDFVARQSIQNYLTTSMPQLITTIFEDTANEFGVTFELQLSQFCQQFYMILVKCIGTQNAERYLKEIASMVMTGSLINLSSIIQKYIDNRKHYDFAEIQQFLMTRPKIQQEDPMEVDDEYPSNQNDRNIQSEDIASDPLPVINQAEPWHSQFPSNWLPTIARDIQRQQRHTNQTSSYSDAYISGMSGKRRKAIQTKKSSNNMKQIIQDCVQDSISSTRPLASQSQPIGEIVESLTSDPGFMNAFRDEVKETLSDRLRNDPDYDESKYPSSSKAFK